MATLAQRLELRTAVLLSTAEVARFGQSCGDCRHETTLPVSVFQQQKVRYQFAYNLNLRHGIRTFFQRINNKSGGHSSISIWSTKQENQQLDDQFAPPFCQNSTVNNTCGWHVTYQKQLLKKQASWLYFFSLQKFKASDSLSTNQKSPLRKVNSRIYRQTVSFQKGVGGETWKRKSPVVGKFLNYETILFFSLLKLPIYCIQPKPTLVIRSKTGF